MRALLSAVILAAICGGAGSAVAQQFPSKPIRFLQGFPAGGNADIISRLLGEAMSKSLGQPMISEARPGASGNLASEQVARAAADGYTMVLLSTAHVISPALLKSLSFDPVKDFEFISMVAEFPVFVAVHRDSPFKSLREMIAGARQKPGSLNWGSAGTGTGQHMAGELLALTTRIKTVHVPFRGDAGSVTALLSQSVDYIMAPSTVLTGNIEGGNFRALAVSSKARASGLKDVPTMIEALGQELVYNSFFGVATTKGVPLPIVERLTKEVHAALADPGIARRLVEMGGSPAPTSSAATAIFVEAQVKRWKEVVAAAGIQAQ